jgi:hypothetical protein
MAIFIGNEIKKLNTSEIFDAVSGGLVLIYQLHTFALNVKAVITSIELRCISATGVTDEATVTIDIAALPIFTRVPIASTQKLTGLLAADDRWTIPIKGGSIVVPHGGAGHIRLAFDSPATGVSQILIADVFGYHTD